MKLKIISKYLLAFFSLYSSVLASDNHLPEIYIVAPSSNSSYEEICPIIERNKTTSDNLAVLSSEKDSIPIDKKCYTYKMMHRGMKMKSVHVEILPGITTIQDLGKEIARVENIADDLNHYCMSKYGKRFTFNSDFLLENLENEDTFTLTRRSFPYY